MLQLVEQRKYIQSFLDFVGTFLITENATISEMNLVKSNAEILLKRISTFENKKVNK